MLHNQGLGESKRVWNVESSRVNVVFDSRERNVVETFKNMSCFTVIYLTPGKVNVRDTFQWTCVNVHLKTLVD